MDDWKLPWSGGCRCGRLRFEVTMPPLLAAVCHCAGCQRMSASAFSLTVTLPETGFRVTEGEPAPGGLQEEIRHHFCPFCKSWVFTTADAMAGIVNLRATMLDDHSWVVPFAEFCTDEKLPWATTGARHAFGGIPPMGSFMPLIEEYGREAPRPG